jgi:hypothetical protein
MTAMARKKPDYKAVQYLELVEGEEKFEGELTIKHAIDKRGRTFLMIKIYDRSNNPVANGKD